MTDPLRNDNDPLRKSGPEAEKELFRALSQLAHGYPNEAVIGAAMNVLVNVIRQAEPKREGARAKFDEVTARVRELLLGQHYDAAGNRRNLFPFHQVIEVPLVQMKRKH
jgi:acyl carrier protein phosphodiesterase